MKLNKRVTIGQVMALDPCEGYTLERVTELFAGRKTMALTAILGLDIPVEDRIWVVTKFLPEQVNRRFACWCALEVVHLWDCPAIVMRYLETQDESIRDAAEDAAEDAAWDAGDAAGAAAWAAARYARVAARASDRYAASAAAWAAARTASEEKQIAELKEMIR